MKQLARPWLVLGFKVVRLLACVSAAMLLQGCSPPGAGTSPEVISLDRYSLGYQNLAGSEAKSALRVSGAQEMSGWEGEIRFKLDRASLEEPCAGELIFSPSSVGLSQGLPDGFSLHGGAPEDITKNLDLASERVRLHEGDAEGETVSLSGGMIQTARVDAAIGLEHWNIGFVCSFWKELPRDLDLEIKTDQGDWRSFPLFGEAGSGN